jgi:PspA associated protein B
VATVNMISDELAAHGFGDQLLAAIFQYTDSEKRHVYLIYNYKRGSFYPFVPNPKKKQERLNALEFRISGVMQKELPIEKEVEAWYPLWGVPL